ncbi:MAG: hypothetical protein K9M99_06040 [Candidatus Cloacimonetes bacterium]|nr:hypothetical protein [Candidatus Cloacimonadota bacterium]
MKKIIIIIAVLSLVGLCTAQLPLSMRNIASDGIFASDWDYIYDPVDLSKSSQMFFFTNLADFCYRYDNLLTDTNEESKTRILEELPLGVAINNPLVSNLRHSLFIRFRHNLTPDDMTGEKESYTTEYSSGAGNPFIYDTKVISYEKVKDYDDDCSNFDLIWNNSFRLSDKVIGLRYSSFHRNEKFYDADGWLGLDVFDPHMIIDYVHTGETSFENYIEYYDYASNQMYFRVDEKGDFEKEISDNQKELMASVELENDFLVSESIMRFDLGLRTHEDISRNITDEYSASFYQLDEDSLSYEGDLSDCYLVKQSYNQQHYYIAAELKKYLGNSFEEELDFYEFGLSCGYLSGDSKNNSLTHRVWQRTHEDYFPEDNITYSDDRNQEVNEAGDFSGFDLNSHFRFNLVLNKYACFGMGCFVKYNYLKHDLDYEADFENIHTTLLGSEFDEEFDTISTETEYLLAEKESIDQTTEMRLPIALEFKIDDDDLSDNDAFSMRNFVYRLSSTFIYNYQNDEDSYNDIVHEPYFIIVEYGTGEVEEDHDSDNVLSSKKTIRKTAISRKLFSAGIGYRHSDNVNIDFAVSYDSEAEDFFFGLSFTVKK